jgi:hypothetical protein
MWCPAVVGRTEGFPKGERILWEGVVSEVYKLADRKLGLTFARHQLFGSAPFGFSLFAVELGVEVKGGLFAVRLIYTPQHLIDIIDNEKINGELYTILDEEFKDDSRDFLSPADMLMLGIDETMLLKLTKLR